MRFTDFDVLSLFVRAEASKKSVQAAERNLRHLLGCSLPLHKFRTPLLVQLKKRIVPECLIGWK